MEFKESIKNLAERIDSLKENIKTEEATKTALIMPFIQTLGYDIFNPMEVVPEFIADVGIKKGEKVDYAILQDNCPIIIIECKHCYENLDNHDSQLHRYFGATEAKFGILTNGIEYRFYTDLNELNKMDSKPFLIFNFEEVKTSLVNQLAKFHKSNFDIEKVLDTASELAISTDIRKVFDEELSSPSEDFVRFFAKKVYDGRLTEKVLESFTEIVKKTVNQVFYEKINERLNTALKKEQAEQQTPQEEEEISRIVTTEEELEGFRIVKTLLRQHINLERITHRDTQSYFGILLDDNRRKPICRLHFNNSKKYIGIFNGEKKIVKHQIENLDEIFNFQEELINTVTKYLTVEV